MTDRIGKFIICENKIYSYEFNKSYFEMHERAIEYKELDYLDNILFLMSKEPHKNYHTETIGIYEDCIFVYEGEEEKYPEYFI
jgi:hypothetical protein